MADVLAAAAPGPATSQGLSGKHDNPAADCEKTRESEKGAEVMTILEYPPLGDCRRLSPATPKAVQGADRSSPAAGPIQDGLLQFQLGRLINEILDDPDLDPGIYLSLLERLAENPGRPGLALIAHLRDIHDPEDLPPCKSQRKPAMPPAEP
jgi:hypothetical protein